MSTKMMIMPIAQSLYGLCQDSWNDLRDKHNRYFTLGNHMVAEEHRTTPIDVLTSFSKFVGAISCMAYYLGVIPLVIVFIANPPIAITFFLICLPAIDIAMTAILGIATSCFGKVESSSAELEH